MTFRRWGIFAKFLWWKWVVRRTDAPLSLGVEGEALGILMGYTLLRRLLAFTNWTPNSFSCCVALLQYLDFFSNYWWSFGFLIRFKLARTVTNRDKFVIKLKSTLFRLDCLPVPNFNLWTDLFYLSFVSLMLIYLSHLLALILRLDHTHKVDQNHLPLEYLFILKVTDLVSETHWNVCIVLPGYPWVLKSFFTSIPMMWLDPRQFQKQVWRQPWEIRRSFKLLKSLDLFLVCFYVILLAYVEWMFSTS